MECRQKIIESLKDAIKELTDQDTSPTLEHPVDPDHGDYSTNIAMQAFGRVRTERPEVYVHKIAARAGNPLEMAEKIKISLLAKNKLASCVEKIEVAAPGFINFWFSEKVLLKELEQALDEGERYGGGEGVGGGKMKKIIIEYTDPNPFKEFHIGHVFTNTVGESLSRFFEAAGAQVKRANYQGDVGLHVAKAIWGLQKKISEEGLSLGALEKWTLSKKVKFLGECYALGNKQYEENKSVQEEIKVLNKKIYALDESVRDLYEYGRQWSLDAFEVMYKRLGTKFDLYYFERETGEEGLKIVRKGLSDGVFKEDKDAVIFPGEKYGLHNRIFINSQGLPTYEAKDLGLAFMKYRDFPYDQSYIITGNEVSEYFRVIIRALSEINPGLGKKAHHVGHGMVRLSTGKLSSRTGKIITGEWLLDEAKNRLKSKYEMPEDVAEKVGVGAIKYALLKSNIGSDVVFDFDTSLSFDGDSGPYLQYTYARTQSVLGKTTTDYRLQPTAVDSSPKTLDLQPEEVAILRTFYKFPEVVSEAAENFSPNILCTFLYDFATKYNRLYNTHRILNAESEEAKNLRLALTQVTGNILEEGLNLLGIQAPEKM